MRETRTNTVHLQEVTNTALTAAVNFMYTGNIEFTWDNIISLLNVGSHLQMDSLLELCQDFLKHCFSLTR